MKRINLIFFVFVAIAVAACGSNSKLFEFSGEVFEDTNRDGIMDPGEPRIQGVTVRLIDETDPSKVLLTTETDPDGAYSIEQVSDSKSFLIAVEADGRTFTKQFRGSNVGLQSHVNVTDGRSDPQEVQEATINAGVLPLEVAQAPQESSGEQATATATQVPPTPTATPTNTPEPPAEPAVQTAPGEFIDFDRLGVPVLYADDAVNDPQPCFIDDPTPENLPGHIDIVAGEVTLLREDPPRVQVEFTYSDTLTRTVEGSTFLGMGFEVDNPVKPNVTDSPWRFDALGDISFNGQQYGTLESLEPSFALVEDGRWNVYQAVHTITTVTNTVVFNVPIEWLYGTVNPLLTATNGEVCDSLELDTPAWTQLINDPPLDEPVETPTPVPIVGNWSEADNAKYMNGGSFAGSTSGPRNRISFSFNLNGAVACENLVMVSVFHIRPDAHPDQILQKPSDGYVEGLGGGLLPYVPPEDADAINGYIVDAPPKLIDPAASGFVPNTNPAMPSFEQNGNTLTAVDEPQFLKEGHTAYFETAVVCLDGGEIKVLGSTRWVHRTGVSRIIPNSQGGVDWGPASESFTGALQGWLDNHQGN